MEAAAVILLGSIIGIASSVIPAIIKWLYARRHKDDDVAMTIRIDSGEKVDLGNLSPEQAEAVIDQFLRKHPPEQASDSSRPKNNGPE